tara:strand:+ start:2794 stop:3429 length:636 start_codon:yes stop_codon:yes gene_type:complete
MLVIRNDGPKLNCARCKVEIKRSDITDEELDTNSRRLIHSFITDIDKKSLSEAELESIERNLEINSKKIVKSHNLEREFKIRQAELIAKQDSLKQRKTKLVEEINKEKLNVNLLDNNRESGIRSPEIPQEPVTKKRKFESKNDISELREELEFYKSVFKSHRNSLVSQVKIKTLNGKKVWIDHIRDDKKLIESLDRDAEIEEWLKPIKSER